MTCLKEGLPTDKFRVIGDFPVIKKELLELAHEKEYIRFVHELHDTVKSTKSSVPFTPRVQEMNGLQPKDEKRCDTFFSPFTLKAALRSAGAVKEAIDDILLRQVQYAFCVVRPPGHHAGIRGLLSNATSCGFCIFNNVAVGARYALTLLKEKERRVAILDIDVHHGNGTEEIVVKHINMPDQIMFISIHIYDAYSKKKLHQFYPGSGARDNLEHNVLNVPLRPLWKRPRRSARTGSNDFIESEEGYGVEAYKERMRNKVIPAILKFSPRLLLVSAGFDGGRGDVGNIHLQKGVQNLGMDLLPKDFEWTASQILSMSKELKCPVLSIMEGGYGHYIQKGRKLSIDCSSLAKNVLAYTKVFASSC